MIREGDIAFLEKALSTLEEDFKDLRKAYDKNDATKFNIYKKKVIDSEKNIVEAAR